MLGPLVAIEKIATCADDDCFLIDTGRSGAQLTKEGDIVQLAAGFMLELRGAQHQLGSYSDFSGSAEARVAISEQELNAGNEAVREHRTIN